MQMTILICTLGQRATLTRVLDRLDHQTAPAGSFEVVVVADARARRLGEIEAATADRRFPVRRLSALRPGASAARNLGLGESGVPLVLFIGDDNLPERDLVSEHLEWHRRHPAVEVGVLGHVRWADELRVTPFMRWLEDGVQFDYPGITGPEAGWERFYTANASVKRSLIERVGGFAADELPFLYEDLDLALRMLMRDHGFRLLYNPHAIVEHLHPVDLEGWKGRAGAIAVAERRFVALHPDFAPYFYEMFSTAASGSRVPRTGASLARFVPRRLPVLGPRVWSAADAFYRQTLAEPFLEAWHSAEAG